jgi:hypothetical protein
MMKKSAFLRRSSEISSEIFYRQSTSSQQLLPAQIPSAAFWQSPRSPPQETVLKPPPQPLSPLIVKMQVAIALPPKICFISILDSVFILKYIK